MQAVIGRESGEGGPLYNCGRIPLDSIAGGGMVSKPQAGRKGSEWQIKTFHSFTLPKNLIDAKVV